jgi:Bacteriophage HK97-gp10, putative tail-component
LPRSLRIPGRVGIANVRLDFDRAAIAVLLYGANGEVGEDIRRRAYAVQKRMKRLAPVDTGQLRDSITVQSTRESSKGPISRVYADVPHAIVAEVGRRPVRAGGTYNNLNNRPTRVTASRKASGNLVWGRDTEVISKRLAFHNKKGDLVFPESVAEAKGARYMERSIDAALD